MSADSFDKLTKALARKTSRRAFIGGVGSAAGAAALGPLAGVARANGTCSSCGGGCGTQQCCSGLTCVNTGLVTPIMVCCPNTQVCGSRCCPSGAVCPSMGTCSCPPPKVPCLNATVTHPFGKCAQLDDDFENCGACGVCCQPGQQCVQGKCVCCPTSCSGCCQNNTCQPGTCDSACGTAGGVCMSCPRGTRCENGTCVCITPCGPCEICDLKTGTCKPAPDGTPCGAGGGNLCTGGGTCHCGTCVGGNPVVCPPPLDPCLTSACDPATGTCRETPKANGTACNDGEECTVNDVCLDGVCTGDPTVRQGTLCNNNTGVCLGGICAAL